MRRTVVLFLLAVLALRAGAQLDRYTVRGRIHLRTDSFFIYRGDTIYFDYVTLQQLQDSLSALPGPDGWGEGFVIASGDSLLRGRGTPGSPLRADTAKLATQHDIAGLGSRWTTGAYGIYRDGRVYVGGPASNTTAMLRVTAESGDGSGIWGQAIQAYGTQNGLTIYAGSGASQSLLKASTSAGLSRLEVKGDGRLSLGAYAGSAMDGAVSKGLGVDGSGVVYTYDPNASSLWTDGGSYLYATGLEDVYFPSSRAISWRNLTGGVGADNYFKIVPDVMGAALAVKYGASDTEVFSVNAYGGVTFADRYSFPASDGTSGQFLKTDGSGSVSWGSEVDGSTTNELNTGMTWTNATNTIGVTDAGGTQSVVITGFLETEVDGSVSNEGSLTVAAGSSSTSVINSNTAGSAGVTLSAGTGIGITESGSTITLSNSAPDQAVSLTGGGINVVTGSYPWFTITGTEVDGSTTNELQNLSLSGNQLSIGGGTGVNFPNFSTSSTTPGWVKGSSGAGSTCFLDATGNWTVPAGAGDMLKSTYDNSGTSNAIDVENGGTGLTSYAPYSLITGGTATAGNLQQVTGTGTTGQILTSNGSGALPSWQNAPSGADNWGTQYVVANSDSLLRGRGTAGSPLRADTTKLATQHDINGIVKRIPGAYDQYSIPVYMDGTGQLLGQSLLYYDSYGNLHSEAGVVIDEGYLTLYTQSVSEEQNALYISDTGYNNFFVYKCNGELYISALARDTARYLLYWDPEHGEITWGPPTTLVQDLTYAAAMTMDYSAGPGISETLGGNTTLNIHNIPDGGEGSLLIRQDGTGGRTLAINTYSDGGVTGLTEIPIGAVTSISGTALKYTQVDYKRYGCNVTLKFFPQP